MRGLYAGDPLFRQMLRSPVCICRSAQIDARPDPLVHFFGARAYGRGQAVRARVVAIRRDISPTLECELRGSPWAGLENLKPSPPRFAFDKEGT